MRLPTINTYSITSRSPPPTGGGRGVYILTHLEEKLLASAELGDVPLEAVEQPGLLLRGHVLKEQVQRA